MFKLEITSGFADSFDKQEHEFADKHLLNDFLISYVNDEANESGGRVTPEELYSAIAGVCHNCAREAVGSFAFYFDGENFSVTDTDRPALYPLVRDNDFISIAHRLEGGLQPELSLYEEPLLLAKLLYDYLVRRELKEADAEEAAWHFARLTELVASPVWLGRDHVAIQFLGTACSETEAEIPDDWMLRGWAVVASSCSGWVLHQFDFSADGMLYRVDLNDEGFYYSVWFFATFKGK